MSKKRIIQLLFLAALIVGTVFIVQRRQGISLHESSGQIFGTTYHIKYEYSQPLDSAILSKLYAVDASLSMFNDSSTVSRINKGTSDAADAMLCEVFSKAQVVSAETGGAYDVTVAPLVNAWGFGFKTGTDVSAAMVDSIKAFVGYAKVRLENNRIVKEDARTMLDFSSIAKGYGVDCVARLFDSLGIRNYMVEIGGEVVVHGMRSDGTPWNIGISQPSDTSEGTVTVLSVTNVAMATSGNYQRYYVKDGKRYAHTIDPHSGRPVQHELLSATVLAPDCATADAYATAFMVMGMERAKAFLKDHAELSAYFIYTDRSGKYATWASDNMKKYLPSGK